MSAPLCNLIAADIQRKLDALTDDERDAIGAMADATILTLFEIFGPGLLVMDRGRAMAATCWALSRNVFTHVWVRHRG